METFKNLVAKMRTQDAAAFLSIFLSLILL